MPAIELRSVTPLDLPVLAQLFREVRGEEFVRTGVPAELLAPLLDTQFHSQQAQYAHVFPAAVDALIELDGQVVGRCWVDRAADVIRVLDVAVVPGARRRGIATRILTALSAEAARSGRCLHLSVWRENAGACALYRALGFELRQERTDGYLELCRPAYGTACPATSLDIRKADAR